MKAAINRLMRPLHRAASPGRPVDPTWADKDTLSLLFTYCTSLSSHWALQQVSGLAVTMSLTACTTLLPLHQVFNTHKKTSVACYQ